MNLQISQLKPAVPAVAVVALLLAVVFPAAAQSTNGTDFASFQIIGQRNIFDPNRVPHRRSTSSAPRVVDSFSFVGTMSYAKGTFAFFDGASPDFRKVLKLDGDIAGFKVTGITSKSVSLQNGTNEAVLQMGMQMRRGDDGQWAVSAEPASYASTGASSGSYGPVGSQLDTAAQNTSSTSIGGESDAVKRLIERRAQEEQQLGQRQ